MPLITVIFSALFEFASDFTKILTKVHGFEKLVSYITNPRTLERLKKIKKIGKTIDQLRKEDDSIVSGKLIDVEIHPEGV